MPSESPAPPKMPRDLNVDESNRSSLEMLVQSENSPYWKRTMKDVFVVSVALGFRNGERIPLRKKRGTIPVSVLTEQDIWLLKSIAVSEMDSLDILLDMREVFQIAEEYANGGIGLLRDSIFSGLPGDPSKRLESGARQVLDKSQISQQKREEREIGKQGPEAPRGSPKDQKNYIIMSSFENEIRRLIRTQLSRVSANWWKERIPQDVREKAEERMEDDSVSSPWLRGLAKDPLDFVSFPDYVKIITKKDNWNEVFETVFKNLAQLQSKMRELEPIRNSISHSRNLAKGQKSALDLYTSQIWSLVKEFESKSGESKDEEYGHSSTGG